MDTLSLGAIVIGDRVRKDMGDLAGLAESMQRHGLLHPVVVTKDRTLVAGHRRIEAARRLGWTEIPVTVVSVEDLLSAECDENEVRKDFTPTEAVAIARLIEEQQQPKAEALRREKIRAAMVRRRAVERGERPVDDVQNNNILDTRAAAARAVGMSPTSYHYAKKVVEAAEADPTTFGDLPAQMDDTGNVAGTYRELRERQGKPVPKKKPAPPPERLPVNSKTPHVKPAQVVQRTVTALDGLCASLQVLNEFSLRMPDGAVWAQKLTTYANALRAFARRLAHEQEDSPVR